MQIMNPFKYVKIDIITKKDRKTFLFWKVFVSLQRERTKVE